MGSANKAVSGAIWSIAANIVNAIYGFLATPLLIAYFGKAEYGLITLATSVNAYMSLMDMGLNSTNVRFFSNWLAKGDNDKVNKLMQTCTAFYGVIGIINAVVLLIVAYFADGIFNVNDTQVVILQQMLCLLAVTSLINWYTSCYIQLISATENVAWGQRRLLLTKLLMIVVVVATLVLHFTIVVYFSLLLLANLAVLPMTVRKIKQLTPFVSLKAKFDKDIFKEILPYSIAIFSFGIFQSSFHSLRPVILGMRGTVEAVTDYGVMNSIANLASLVGTVFIGALLPASSRVVVNRDDIAYYKVAYQGTRFIAIVLCCCSFGLMSIGRDLISLYVGDDFLYLIPWLNIWLIALLGNHNSAISSLILAGINIKALGYTSAFSSIIGIILCWYLSPIYHAGGVVIAYLSYVLCQLLFFYLYYWPKKMKINSWQVFTKSFIPYLTIGYASHLATLYLPKMESHWISMLGIGTVFTICYTIGVLLVIKKEDKDFLSRKLFQKENL